MLTVCSDCLEIAQARLYNRFRRIRQSSYHRFRERFRPSFWVNAAFMLEPYSAHRRIVYILFACDIALSSQ